MNQEKAQAMMISNIFLYFHQKIWKKVKKIY